MSVVDRVIVIILDSVGIGSLPDADEYGDEGANTLVHVAEHVGGLNLPNLQKLGMGNILDIRGVQQATAPLASFGRMAEASKGKDTIAGHWEIMGYVVEEPFALFPNGFPQEMVKDFLDQSGCEQALGNRAASGTVIIQDLGEEHMRTGWPIVYTSADSVFQIAAHEKIMPLEKLYAVCKIARNICDAYRVGRVIARPFVGEAVPFTRTANRKDFPMRPPAATVLDVLKENGLPVVGIGKIENIFAGRGVTRSLHSENNDDGMRLLLEEVSITSRGLLFINLVDFDMLYGHRNDASAYGAALEAFDGKLGTLLDRLGERDMLIITADHGCDPTYAGTDHTREYVPLLVYSKALPSRPLGTRKTFADIGAAVLSFLGLKDRLPRVSEITQPLFPVEKK